MARDWDAACVLAGLDPRTLGRHQPGPWRSPPEAERPVPPHALSEAERAQIIAVANQQRFAAMPPARIVPALADEGTYIGAMHLAEASPAADLLHQPSLGSAAKLSPQGLGRVQVKILDVRPRWR